MSIKPNLLEIESLRSELIEKSVNTSSNFLRLFLYQNYFGIILPLNNPNLEEAFLKEFLDDYIACICKFEVCGVEPEFAKNIIEQIKKITAIKIAAENLTLLNPEVDRIETQYKKLSLMLEGKDFEDGETNKAFFPLIDKEAPVEHPYGTGFYGILDSVTVWINKSAEEDKFIIIPSEKEIEEKIAEQCKKSWLLALHLSKEYVKRPYKYHEVIISFDNKQGFYEGNSLGIALTLSFLEQILKFYNPTYIINIKEQSAFTGGVTEVGEVLCTSEEIIKQKVAAVFFSEINTFVFPKCEETYAYFALTQLKKNYPNRKLKLIAVEEIKDVLNRRDVVDIKKQKLVVRSGKFVKKNWISAVATVLLAILFAYLFVMDFDDNPAFLSADGNTLYTKNKNGKVLWTKLVSISKTEINNNTFSDIAKILDIDNDRINEIILRGEKDPVTYEFNNSAMVVCYNYQGKVLWNYTFQDTVLSEREILNSEYTVNILDTLTFDGQNSLLMYASNGPSFSSAVFRLDLKTGKRLPGTFWASGHVMDGVIKDIDNDSKPDFVGVGYDNGYEDFVFFAYELDTLIKVRPTTEPYLISGFPVSEMKSYIRFPKTDFDNYYKVRTPGFCINSFSNDENNLKFIFATAFPKTVDDQEVGYEVNYNLKNVNVVIDSDFKVQRDTLVAHGKLNQPYTDTDAYKEIIRKNILYWKDGKWVNRFDVEKK